MDAFFVACLIYKLDLVLIDLQGLAIQLCGCADYACRNSPPEMGSLLDLFHLERSLRAPRLLSSGRDSRSQS